MALQFILSLHLFAVTIFSTSLSNGYGYCVMCINFLECEQEPFGRFLSNDDIPIYKHMWAAHLYAMNTMIF